MEKSGINLSIVIYNILYITILDTLSPLHQNSLMTNDVNDGNDGIFAAIGASNIT